MAYQVKVPAAAYRLGFKHQAGIETAEGEISRSWHMRLLKFIRSSDIEEREGTLPRSQLTKFVD